ncbi:MAG: TMEM175 family protein [Thermoflexibacteraceae bacterium]
MTTNRIEAFSDGIIAIIITIMIFDLKLSNKVGEDTVWQSIYVLLPKFTSYTLSFLTVAIMWINHHQLFHLFKKTDRPLLWLNIHLLFWMSLIPFVTNLLGENHNFSATCMAYGFVMFMNSTSFLLLRHYTNCHEDLLKTPLSPERKRRSFRKNIVGVSIYFLTIPLALVSVYCSFIGFLLVPLMYFLGFVAPLNFV